MPLCILPEPVVSPTESSIPLGICRRITEVGIVRVSSRDASSILLGKKTSWTNGYELLFLTPANNELVSVHISEAMDFNRGVALQKNLWE